MDDAKTELPWRKQQRNELLQRRLAITPQDRRAWSEAISGHLAQGFTTLAHMVVGFCWPYKGEYNALAFVDTLLADGVRLALPVVVAKGEPLQFRQWWHGVAMSAGVFNIPVPDNSPILVPDALLIPPVGFDEHGFRLGYGGGFFDRTLAAMQPQALKIGVAFELARMPSIGPQAHDIPMDFIVTQAGLHAVDDSHKMTPITGPECAERAAQIAKSRGLPRRQP